MSWNTPLPNWDTLAGRVLDAFFKAVSKTLPTYELPLTIFGSAPIQLCLDEDFTSADVDIMVLEGDARLRTIAADAGVGRAGPLRPAYGIQICPPALFRPTPHYLQRAHVEVRQGLKIVIPNVRDILIGKLHRSRYEGQQGIVPKDLKAFLRVRELCGDHPTLDEFLADLVSCEPFFRPIYDGGINSFRFNAEDALLDVYGHTLDLHRDILAPAQRGSRPFLDLSPGTVAEMLDELDPDHP